MRIRVQYLDKVEEFSPDTTLQNIWQVFESDLSKQRTESLFKLGIIVLIPPIGLLIFGLMSFWVIHGFSPKSENT